MSFLSKLLRRRRPSPDVDEIARNSGLADVDPQPMTHTAGEGVVPGEIEAAHSVQDQRDKLPNARERGR